MEILVKDRNFSDLLLPGFREISINLFRFLGLYSTSQYGRARKIKIWSLVFFATLVETLVYSSIFEFQKPLMQVDDFADKWGNLVGLKGLNGEVSVLFVIGLIITAEVVGLISLYLCLLLAGKLRRSAQKDLIISLEAVRSDDPRHPILFLRPFKDDQVALDSAQASFIARTLDPASSSDSLEYLILRNMDYVGPLVCIGNPTDKRPPLGAARIYLDDAEWKDYALNLMMDSALIVVGVDSSAGLRWEIEAIKKHNNLSKTLFIFPPNMALTAVKSVLTLFPLNEVPLDVLETGEKIVGLFYSTNSRPIFLTANRLTEIEYELCLRYFMSKGEIANISRNDIIDLLPQNQVRSVVRFPSGRRTMHGTETVRG
jgi:hypothetical protein